MPASLAFLEHNLAEIRGLNQRGGRMLSIIDLISRETITIDLAAYLLVKIRGGASFLCCSMQGGVGKTTLMGALLGLLPPSEEIVTVASEADLGILQRLTTDGKRRSLVVHEIGSGSWYGYLWGKPVLDYVRLKNPTTRIVSNIHADALEDVTAQFISFGGTAAEMLEFDLVLFITLGKGNVGGERRRIVNDILEITRQLDHRANREKPAHFSKYFSKLDIQGIGSKYDHEIRAAREFLQGLLAENTMLVEEVAARVAAFHDRLDRVDH
ncbi:MAG: hypothetical protein Q6373_009065 [Candidatus Sigynarchaeota archaeon]